MERKYFLNSEGKLAAVQTEMEGSMLNMTQKGKKDQHVGQREDVGCRHDNQQCEKKDVVLGRAHQLPQRRPMDLACHHLERKKRRQGRPAKRWRDDLDKYWSDTIWQRTAQDRVIWGRHAEAFAQPRDTTAA